MHERSPHHLSRLDTPVHRLDPRTKLILAVSFAVLVVSTPPTRLAAFVGYAGLLSWAAALAGIPLAARGDASCRGASLFGAGGVVAALSSRRTRGSFVGRRRAAFCARTVVIVGCSDEVVSRCGGRGSAGHTTPLHELAGGLRKLGVPVILVDTLTLTYRYLFVLLEEATRLRRAAAARGYRPRWLGQALLIGRLIGQLFMRSYERAERVYDAMVQRGYRGQMPTSRELAFGKADVAALVILLPTLIAVRTWLR